MIFVFNIREANLIDIPELMSIRLSVNENQLSDPALVPHEDYLDFITNRGKGWVAEIEDKIVGFAIVDMRENNIWALFMDPNFEKKGIGKELHNLMIHWYFEQTKNTVWLGTEANSRAADFYRKSGWTEVGLHGKNEIKFEMTCDNWNSRISNRTLYP